MPGVVRTRKLYAHYVFIRMLRREYELAFGILFERERLLVVIARHLHGNDSYVCGVGIVYGCVAHSPTRIIVVLVLVILIAYFEALRLTVVLDRTLVSARQVVCVGLALDIHGYGVEKYGGYYKFELLKTERSVGPLIVFGGHEFNYIVMRVLRRKGYYWLVLIRRIPSIIQTVVI